MMNRKQEIFMEGVGEKIKELRAELDNIPRDHGDEEDIMIEGLFDKILILQLAFKAYILEVVNDFDT